ncbi:DUF6242 domain-containing protein [Flavobacteriaceae bacterium F08102]|nr:DUF6242 domain-containing protein [Flavobacteriaceae bacterium F08102]
MKTTTYFKQVLLFVGIIGTLVTTSCSDDGESLSDLTGILSFGFTDEIAKDFIFEVDNSNFVIKNNDSLPYQFDVSQLTAQFTTIEGSTVTVNGIPQISGQTTNDFSSPVTYVVTAEDGKTTKTYTVDLAVAQLNPEGLKWNQASPNAFDASYDSQAYFTIANKHFMIVGKTKTSDVKLYSSTDGKTWTEETITGDFPAGTNHNIVVRDNVAYVVGFIEMSDPYGLGIPEYYQQDLSIDLYSTTDGLTWTKTEGALGSGEGWGKVFYGRVNTPSFNLDNTIYAVGGNTPVFQNFNGGKGEGGVFYPPANVKNNTLISTDGVTFTESEDYTAEMPRRTHAASFIKDGKMYIVGGLTRPGIPLSDVWSSTDGVTWTQVSDGAFPARFKASTIVYDDKIWMFGGILIDGTNPKDILVSSDNGVTWETAAEDQALPDNFKARCNAKVVVDNDGNLIIMGGESSVLGDEGLEYTTLTDIWIGKLNKLN